MNGFNGALDALDGWYYAHASGFVLFIVALAVVLCAAIKHDMLFALINVALFIPVMTLLARNAATRARHHFTPGATDVDTTAEFILSELRAECAEVRAPAF